MKEYDAKNVITSETTLVTSRTFAQ